MSQSTPAKQERYERHLMRQRGAGVRQIATNFAFSFEFAAQTSSEPMPLVDPAGKRQDTVVGHCTSTPEKGNADGPTLQRTSEPEPAPIARERASKTRRKLPVDQGPMKPTNDDDNSLVAAAQPTKSRAKRKPQATEAASGIPEKKARMRRKVAEPVPVESPEPTKKPSPMPTVKRRGKRKPVEQPPFASEELEIPAKQPPTPPPSGTITDEDTVEANPKGRLKAMRRKPCDNEDENRRQPLLETDVNVSRPSMSPQKLKVDVKNTDLELVRRRKVPTELHSPRMKKGRQWNVHVKPDLEPPAPETAPEIPPAFKAAAESSEKPISTTRESKKSKPSDNNDNDNMDWLFSASAKQAPSLSSKPAALTAKNSKRFSDMADIDLDDLVSNIASIAPVLAVPASISGSEVAKRSRKR